MDRRKFLKSTGKAAAAGLVMPYILPSGRVFAQTGSRRVNHVVFCLYAGGVRWLDSLQKQDGNLMPFTLSGSEAVASDIAASMSPLPSPTGPALQTQGTLFNNFWYKQGPTGHFNAHATAITGVYNTADVNIRQRPAYPTVFELYRKHNSPSAAALNAWWVSNSLGPYPALNFSEVAGYGANYGANYIQPGTIISQAGYEVLGNSRQFSEGEKSVVDRLRTFCDDNFGSQFQAGDAGVTNSAADAERLEAFIKDLFTQGVAGAFDNPWDLPTWMSGDMYNIFFAEKIIEEFQPELLVVNMQDVDVCHTNYTGYADALRRADYALWHLWQTIQSTPGMANDTILIAAPEHGRNLEPNTVIDANGRYALDHTGDEMSRRVFSLVLGPAGVVNQNTVVTTEHESIDLVPTIANILGFDVDMPSGLVPGSVLTGAFA